MKMPFRIKTLTFTDGTTVNISDSDIVVLVGANNSGKSRTLNDIATHLRAQPNQRNIFIAVEAIELTRTMSRRQLISWIKSNRYTFPEDNQPSIGPDGKPEFKFKTAPNIEMTTWSIPNPWIAGSSMTGMQQHLVGELYPASRLGVQVSGNRHTYGTHPDTPLNTLLSRGTFDEFKRRIKDAFGWEVILDAWGGNLLLRISKYPQSHYVIPSDSGWLSPKQTEMFAKLEPLESQSDGVKSFYGIILTLLASIYPLTLIDEPEAFLHPPQATRLGKAINEIQHDGQTILATHDVNMLMGLLSRENSKVTILRLRKVKGKIVPKEMRYSDLRALWDNPLLRYSRTLEGMFHDGVVICEGDSDCQFYSTVYDLIKINEESSKKPKLPDLAFVHSAGKHRMDRIIKALSAVSVPVVSVVDFDILDNPDPLKRILIALGMPHEERRIVESLRSNVDMHIRQGAVPITKGNFVTNSISILTSLDDSDELQQSTIRALKEQLKVTGWEKAKKLGAGAITDASVLEKYKELDERLRAYGLFIVSAGSLESHVPEINGDKSQWLVKVMEQDKARSSTSARKLLKSLTNKINVYLDR